MQISQKQKQLMPEFTFVDLLKFVGGGGVGGFAGSYLAHRFTLSRDQENRKRNFKGFLEEWRAITEQTATENIPTHYFEHVRSFRREAERVRGDYSDSRRFSALVMSLGHMNPQAIRGDGTKPSRIILAEAIDALLTFCRDA